MGYYLVTENTFPEEVRRTGFGHYTDIYVRVF